MSDHRGDECVYRFEPKEIVCVAYRPRPVRDALVGREGSSERKMFGGIGFMLGGNMACGVIGEDLIVRLESR